jgi:hypothetical protein
MKLWGFSTKNMCFRRQNSLLEYPIYGAVKSCEAVVEHLEIMMEIL